jgi:dienelactone hydrolase
MSIPPLILSLSRRAVFLVRVSALALCLPGSWGLAWAKGVPDLAVAAFVCDVTPPVGHPLCGGWIKPLEVVDDPLLAKGVVLFYGKERYVLCAVDWCLLQTAACDMFRDKVAAAAGVSTAHVAVHTVHQHNAPIADANAQLLLNGVSNAPVHLDLKFLGEVTDRLASAVREACSRPRQVTHVGEGTARVERFASNRRVRLADGKIHPRFSSTKDPVLQAAPEGLIDPWLRTVTLLNGDQPLVRLHYYATHPQSYYGDGRATADTVGLARERLEKEERVPQVYFTGCAGDITAGKYNDGSPRAREELTGRMLAAMRQAVTATRRSPVDVVEWKTATVQFAPRTEREWSEETSRRDLNNAQLAPAARLQAALNLAWSERLKTQPGINLSRLTLGPVDILHLPGEALLEFQLYAQSLRPNRFVAVAAYGEGGPGYICPDATLAEGGYEPTDSRVGPPSEARLKAAIGELLRPVAKLPFPPTYPDKQHLLVWRDSKGREHPVNRPKDWNTRRAHILASLQMVMGPMPSKSRQVPLEMRVEAQQREASWTRQKITFAVEPHDRVPAWLLIPNDRKGKLPAMLCLHQTTAIGKDEPAGLGGKANLHYAAELAARGFVTLAPDYPGYGDYRADAYGLGYASATMKGIWNHMRAVDLLESLPQVDRARLGVIGHSLGGHNALFVAAFDPRLKAVVASCGFNSFFSYRGGDLTGWSHAGYMPRIATVYGKDPKQMPFDFTELLATLAPRPVFINAPLRDDNFAVTGVMDCLAAARPVYRLYQAEENLVVQHPESDHDFPTPVREAAYEWLVRSL